MVFLKEKIINYYNPTN